MPMQSEGLGMAHGADGGALQPPCVCVTVFLAWIRSRPNELWRFDDLVSQLSFFAHSGVREAGQASAGPHTVVT